MKYSIFPNKSGHIFARLFYFIQKQKRKVQKKNDRTINEHICTTSDTKKMPKSIKYARKSSKNKESRSYSDENEKMKCIEFLFSCNIESGDKNQNTENDEHRLEWIHLKNEELTIKNEK